MSSETPLFFNGKNNKRLFGIFHEPSGHLTQKNRCIIICHSLFAEKLHAHRILVNFSRYVAATGINVFRFDLQGNGESEGRFEEFGVNAWVEDIDDAIKWVKNKLDPVEIYLLGIRFGASLSLRYAQQYDDINGLIVWAPILKINQYLNSLLRANLSAQMVVHKKVVLTRKDLIANIRQGKYVNVDGYLLGNPLWKEATELIFSGNFIQYQCKILFYQISPSSSLEKDIITFSNNDDLVSLVDIKKFREKKFWLPQKIVYPSCLALFQGTVNWVNHINNG